MDGEIVMRFVAVQKRADLERDCAFGPESRASHMISHDSFSAMLLRVLVIRFDKFPQRRLD